MKLLEALTKSKQGFSIKSNSGKVYTPDMLNVKWIGEHYGSCQACGMTEDERKGEWSAVN
ncbi:hypothetical protein [Bacillus smithii]|uniref:hypothetical protein n=1 Tax=Bacillus smithii TaxID=1479 RepID=UPI003D1E2F28